MKTFSKNLWRGLILAMLLGSALAQPTDRPAAAQAGHTALVLSLEGPLTPVMTSYLERGLGEAQRVNAELIVLTLDTPGGQIDLMQQLVEQIRNSPTPVVVYVTPRGAWAGSAGLLITLAGHVAAMAPETSIGASSPVSGEGADLDETSDRKLKEILRAQVRTLAARRPPEAIALAEAAIEEAKAVNADEALEAGLIDVMADDLPRLLQQLDGFTVELNGQARPLATTGLTLTEVPWNLLETFLHVLTSNTQLLFLLITIGGWLLWIEISQPGGWVAGFAGIVCLALAFYGLGSLPVNWFGLVFIILAFILFFMELQTPTYGGLTAAAVGCLIVGGLVLFNSSGTQPYMQISWPFVVAVSLAIGGLSFALLWVALRSRNLPLRSGVETLIGKVGEARSANSVQVAGELWTAEPESGTLEAGQSVVVTEVRGLKVRVRKQ
jgi:membrane-bound serine protease (ClpP class)